MTDSESTLLWRSFYNFSLIICSAWTACSSFLLTAGLYHSLSWVVEAKNRTKRQEILDIHQKPESRSGSPSAADF